MHLRIKGYCNPVKNEAGWKIAFDPFADASFEGATE
jgi:hypothetical protein